MRSNDTRLFAVVKQAISTNRYTVKPTWNAVAILALRTFMQIHPTVLNVTLALSTSAALAYHALFLASCWVA